MGFLKTAAVLLAAHLVHAQIDPPGTPYPGSTYADAVDSYDSAGAKSFQTSAPFYPSPWTEGAGDWADAYTKAKAFVSKLTLTEKVNLTTGVG